MRLYPHTKKRVQHDDGSWSDVVTVRFPASRLTFADIVQREHQIRTRDAAHLRDVKARFRMEEEPVIVAWACLEVDQSAQQLFPNINTVTDSGERILSANSLLTYTLRTILGRGWLFHESGQWHLNIPAEQITWQTRADAVLRWLIDNDRLTLVAPPDQPLTRSDFADFNALYNAIPVGRVGFLRHYVTEQQAEIAFNTAYFLLEHDDFISHHSALGDPYNLMVTDSEINRPPIYKRAALWADQNGDWHADQIGMEDMRIYCEALPDWQISFVVNPPEAVPVALYTRHYAVDEQGQVVGFTPPAVDRVEFTVIDRQIVSVQRGGGLEIPQNGFVLSFAGSAMTPAQIEQIITDRRITYTFKNPDYVGMTDAIQAGPVLIKNGKIGLSDDVFTREEFWPSRRVSDVWTVGVVPTDYPLDVDRTRAGRVGIGYTRDGEIVVVAVAGVNAGFDHNNTDSVGATLQELTDYLLSAGAIEAINLDGGGSSQLFIAGGLVTIPGDRRGLPGVYYDRMIPSAGVVHRD